MVELPAGFAASVRRTWGDVGDAWLRVLPGVAAEVLRAWGLRPGPVFALARNWVSAVVLPDGGDAVLKLGPAAAGHLPAEIAALRAFGGNGAVRLLRHDADRGALLLERATPGTDAAGLVPADDEEATSGAVTALRALHVPAPQDGTLPPLSTLTRALRDAARTPAPTHPPPEMVARAAALLTELEASAPPPVVLHGDLHHQNLLRATRSPWLAIDPHGAWGDPGYDVGAWLHNPMSVPRAEVTGLVRRRTEHLADGLDLPLDRVIAWGYVKAVLSEVWFASEGETVGTHALAVARVLEPLLP